MRAHAHYCQSLYSPQLTNLKQATNVCEVDDVYSSFFQPVDTTWPVVLIEVASYCMISHVRVAEVTVECMCHNESTRSAQASAKAPR